MTFIALTVGTQELQYIHLLYCASPPVGIIRTFFANHSYIIDFVCTLLSIWVMRIARTRHPNIAAVALANKTARIAWAMMNRGSDYQPIPA
jgi:hypothetical protein